MKSVFLPARPTGLPALLLALLLAWCPVILADTQYASTPYPPACATQLPEVLDPSDPNVALAWSGLLTLESLDTQNNTQPSYRIRQMHADIYRVGCAEPGRSIILVEFRLPDYWTPIYSALLLPEFRGFTPWESVLFELKPEPNARGQSLQQNLLTRTVIGDFEGWYWVDARQYRWRYVLDLSHLGADWGDMTAYYNRAFGLEIDAGKGAAPFAITIPATADVLHASPSLPLNGRLGGTWVETGAADQGFLLTFGHPVPPTGTVIESPEGSELHVFLSWFTFDAMGEPLWLVGDTRFSQGVDSVALPLWRVSAARFMSGWVETGLADGPYVPAGELHLRARNCNALEVSYELEALGLGVGEMRLERLFAQETAGYPCRDELARLESLASQPAN